METHIMKNKFCFESELLKDIIISLIDIQDKELKNLGYGSFEKLPIIKKSILNYFNDEMFKKCYIAITSNSQNPYEIFNNILLAIIKDLVELSELDKFRLENFINRNMLLYPNCIIVRDDENNIIFIIKFVGIEYKIKIPNSTNINNINGRSGELSVWGAEITEEKFPKLLDDNLHFKHYGNILSLSKLYLAQTTNNTYPTLLAKIGGYYYYIRLVADILSNEFIIPGTNLKVEKCNEYQNLIPLQNMLDTEMENIDLVKFLKGQYQEEFIRNILKKYHQITSGKFTLIKMRRKYLNRF